MTLQQYRSEFEIDSNRSISMPLAGTIVWLIVGLLSTQISENISIYVLLFATGAIFPIALLIAKFRNENLVSSSNPFSKLMGLCVLMVNLLWAVHIPLLFKAPELVPLTLGIGLGLHWIVYSWIVSHPVGIVHAVLRTLLILLAWYLFPEQGIAAISAAVVLVYIISIYQMLTRPISLSNA